MSAYQKVTAAPPHVGKTRNAAFKAKERITGQSRSDTHQWAASWLTSGCCAFLPARNTICGHGKNLDAL